MSGKNVAVNAEYTLSDYSEKSSISVQLAVGQGRRY